MEVFIAGETQGKRDIEVFMNKEQEIKELGLMVYDPYHNYAQMREMTYRQLIDLWFKKIAECDILYLFNNWEKSESAMLLKHYAETVQMKTFTDVKDIEEYIKKENEKVHVINENNQNIWTESKTFIKNETIYKQPSLFEGNDE